MSSASQRLLILTALDMEARAIAAGLGLSRGPVPHVWFSPAAPHLELRAIGVHAVDLPDTLYSASAIILAGLAGALDPSLGIGDLIMDGTFCPSPAVGGVRIGAIHSADHLISTPAAKRDLFAATGALAVDMEAAPLRASLARGAALPFLHLRAISDMACDGVDPILLDLVDSFGRPRSVPLAVALLRHPSLLPQLLRLNRHSRLALARLASALREIIDTGWPTSGPPLERGGTWCFWAPRQEEGRGESNQGRGGREER